MSKARYVVRKVGNDRTLAPPLPPTGDGDIEETSVAGAGGGLTGYTVPLASGSVRPAKRDTKKKKQKQYIDLGLLAEVMELIIEKGYRK